MSSGNSSSLRVWSQSKAALIALSMAVLATSPLALAESPAMPDPGAEPVVFTGEVDNERSYVRSKESDLATQSYIAEVTVKIIGGLGVGCAFFGISDGDPNPSAFYTPTMEPSATFLIGTTEFAGSKLTASLNLDKVEEVHYVGNGTHRLRLRWDAKRKIAQLDVHANWTPGAIFTPSYQLSVDTSALTFTPDQRFVCGGAGGVTFSDFSAKAVPSSDLLLGDETAGKWLPVGLSAKQEGSVLPVDAMLGSLGGSARLLGLWYDNAKMIAARSFDKDNKLSAAGANWESTVTAKDIPEVGQGVEAKDMTVKFKLAGGSAIFAGVAVAFDFAKWDPANYVFTPSILYNGNKFRILPIPYPPYISKPEDRPPNMPITVTNILNIGPNTGGLAEMLTSNLATPMAGFFDRENKSGFLVLTKPKTTNGITGVLVQEDAKEGKMSIVLSAPGVRSERYSGDDGNVPSRRAESPDRGAMFQPGDEVTMEFQVYKFPAASIPEFLAKAFDVRKAMTGANTYRDMMPFSSAVKMLVEQNNREKWFGSDKYQYYSAGGGDYRHQIGWNGNPIFGLPNAIEGSQRGLERASSSLDMLVDAQGSTGLFPAIFNNGVRKGDTFYDSETEENKNIAMARRSGDVLYFGLQNLIVLEKQGVKIKPEWKEMLRKCADGLKKLYDRYGEFGQYANIETGEMVINGSTAGSANIQALALASAYFKKTDYMATAKAAGDMYYKRDLSQGYAGGGAAEILQSPDSEAPWDLSEAYMVLYDLSTDPAEKQKWLTYARDAINMLATWTVSYDYEFSPESDMGRVGTKSAGSIFASSQNNHAAPGYYIMSGDFLLKYFRASGDIRYAELYKDVTHNVTQYLNTPTNRLQSYLAKGDDPENPKIVPAYVSERVQLSDWEGPNIGDAPPIDSNQAWEILVQLAGQQNPGIYYNTTSDYLLVLDHVKTERIGKDSSGTRLKLTNTTPYDAEVKILAETGDQAAKPLDHAAYMDWPKVFVESGKIVQVLISPTGQVSTYKP